MWVTTLSGISYAESNDGQTFTPYSGNPVISGQGWSKLFKKGSTYFYYTGAYPTFPPTSINVYASTDGLAWTLAKSGTLSVGAAGQWDSATILQLNVAGNIAGTWYGYYGATNGSVPRTWSMGQVISTDLITWTKSTGNPKITAYGPSNFDWHAIGGTIYGWSQICNCTAGELPSDISRYSSSSVAGPFVPITSNPLTLTFWRSQPTEGPGLTNGQVADPVLLSVNGDLYMYFTATTTGLSTSGYQINLAKAPGMTFSQLLFGNEGVVTFH
jgi:hypothetical protein